VSAARRGATALLAAWLLFAACSSNGETSTTTSSTSATSLAPTTTTSPPDPALAEWHVYGHDLANSRTNTTEVFIDRESVARLAPTWQIGDVVGVTGTPVVADGVAYITDWTGAVRALDADTGDEQWKTMIGGQIVPAAVVADDAVFAASGHTLFKLDRATGAELWRVDTHDHPQAQISSSPVVVGDMVVQGTASFENFIVKDDYTFRGAIAAYDVATGAERWKLFTTDDSATSGAGAGVWSTPAVDIDRGVLYVGTGQTLEDPTAPLGDSLVAIQVETGDIVWSTQFTYPDVFSQGHPIGKDADVGASPNLWTVDGRDLVGAGDKGGTFHAVDRETGEIVWETELAPGSFLGGEIGSAAYVGDRLIVSSNVGDPTTNSFTNTSKVMALDPATGDIAWTAEFDGMIFGPISAVPGVAFVGTDVGTMRALDIDTGAILWSFDAPNGVGGGAAIVAGRLLWGYGFVLFGGPGEGGVIAFEPAPEPEPAIEASTGCEARRVAAPGTTDLTLESGGVSRQYQLGIPEGYDGRRPYPVVFGLHALTVDYHGVAIGAGFSDAAPRNEFVAVMPSGRRNGTTPFWNAAPVDDNYDVVFIADLLDHLEATFCIDSGRVFSTGMSNGAQMSSLLACRLSERFAGVAPVAGVEYLEPCSGDPVPIIAFHGRDDPILPYTGGGLNATTIANAQYYKGDAPSGWPAPLGVDESMARFAEHNECDPEPIETEVAPGVTRRRWSGCAAPTEFYALGGVGHSWPGRPVPAFETQFGPGTTAIDATALMFEFFAEATSTSSEVDSLRAAPPA
jgi:polyvinyl alcohol dehydrogenase (cytochrome)